ncbi:MAG TPA: DUF302 domain-containing protein [Thermohalobaculum sp.]|nr:DUF302 domain-containing protein [Thermohalobaculum sp.]
MKRFAVFITAMIFATQAYAGMIAPRDGWAVHDTTMGYTELVDSMTTAIKAEGMFIVTQAGPTAAAAKSGIVIPNNRVFGIYRNDYAVRTLATSTAAMIEAPIRLYVTENADGTATLSYKTPGAVFAPYLDEGGAELSAIAVELDAIFATIAARAVAK